jgi:hypothetical protein
MLAGSSEQDGATTTLSLADGTPARMRVITDDSGSEASTDALPVSTPTSASRERDSGGVGTCGCSYIDPQTRANLSESLLLAASHAAILDTHAKPFASAEGSVPGLFQELRNFLLHAPASERHSLVGLQARVTAFVETKRTWLTRAPLASEASLAEKALAMKTSLGALPEAAKMIQDADSIAKVRRAHALNRTRSTI